MVKKACQLLRCIIPVLAIWLHWNVRSMLQQLLDANRRPYCASLSKNWSFDQPDQDQCLLCPALRRLILLENPIDRWWNSPSPMGRLTNSTLQTNEQNSRNPSLWCCSASKRSKAWMLAKFSRLPLTKTSRDSMCCFDLFYDAFGRFWNSAAFFKNKRNNGFKVCIHISERERKPFFAPLWLMWWWMIAAEALLTLSRSRRLVISYQKELWNIHFDFYIFRFNCSFFV